jgi:acyl carrier protein
MPKSDSPKTVKWLAKKLAELLDVDKASISGDTRLPEAAVLDSTEALELVMEIEEKFGINFYDGELPQEAFLALLQQHGTVGEMASLIDSIAAGECESPFNSAAPITTLDSEPDDQSGERLDQEIARQFLKDSRSVDLDGFSALDDDAAELLASSRKDLCLDGLIEISAAAAKALIPHTRAVSLQSLQRVSLAAAEFLSQHVGPLRDLNLKAFVEDPAVFAALRRHSSLVSQIIDNDYQLIQLLSAKDIDTEGSSVFGCADASSRELNDEEYCGDPVADGLRLVEKAEGQPVWMVQLCHVKSEWEFEDIGEHSLYFVGERDDVLRRIDALPNRIATVQIVRKCLREFDSDGGVSFQTFGALDAAAAGLLASDFPWGEGNELRLSGILHLPPEVAASLSRPLPQDDHSDKVPSLVLSGCRDVSEETAQALSSRKWGLQFPYLRTVSPEAAEYLARVPFLFLGVEELSAAAAARLATCRDLGIRMPRLNADVASSLSKTAGPLCIEIRDNLSVEAASALGARCGTLVFLNLRSLSAAAGKELASHQGTLDLGSCELSLEAAKALCHHDGELLVSKSQPPDVAAILKQHPSVR